MAVRTLQPASASDEQLRQLAGALEGRQVNVRNSEGNAYGVRLSPAEVVRAYVELREIARTLANPCDDQEGGDFGDRLQELERLVSPFPAGQADSEPEATVAEELERKAADTTRP